MTHADLCVLASKWLRNKCGCGVVAQEVVSNTHSRETPDAIGWRSDYSVLIECKTSRADFLADKRKVFRKVSENGMGNFRFYLCPEWLINCDDLPPKWGLLHVVNGKIVMICGPQGNIWSQSLDFYHHRNLQNELILLVSICRRLQSHTGLAGKIK